MDTAKTAIKSNFMSMKIYARDFPLFFLPMSVLKAKNVQQSGPQHLRYLGLEVLMEACNPPLPFCFLF